MSKYTTQVRYICEQKFIMQTPMRGVYDTEHCYELLLPYAELHDNCNPYQPPYLYSYITLKKSPGADKVDCILKYSWDKIFKETPPEGWTYFDDYYPKLCRKILKHYYLREIGAETAGIWTLWMRTRMEEIIPYYSQLYNSTELQFNPLEDVDIHRVHSKDDIIDGTDNKSIEKNCTGNYSQNELNKFSDTPQGSVSAPIFDSYLTNANQRNTTGNTGAHSIGSDNTIMHKAMNQDFDETITGKQGTGSYSKLLSEYRETMLNIDLKVINEFKDMFFLLW